MFAFYLLPLRKFNNLTIMMKFLKPIAAVLLFLLMQVIGSFIAVIIVAIGNPKYREALLSGNISEEVHAAFLSPNVLAWALVISSILTMLALVLFMFVDSKKVFDASMVNWKWAGIAIMAAVSGIFSTDLVSEWLDLPNMLEEQFLGMSKSAVGILSIAVLGPIVEELTFREAIIGGLMKKGVGPWVAIIFSALCFGLIHGNPAQVPFACIAGLILGIVYAKTGNIVVTSIIHIINNSIAVIEMNLLGDEAEDLMFKDILGVADIPVIIITAALCVFLLNKYWKSNTIVEA